MRSFIEDVLQPHKMLPNVLGMEPQNCRLYHQAVVLALPEEKKSRWASCYEDSKQKVSASYAFNDGDTFVWLSLRMELDVSIEELVCSSFETDLWGRWHPIVHTNTLLSPPAAWRQVCHWKKSLPFGLMKGEMLSDIYRFMNTEKCFLAENVAPLDELDPLYFPEQKGLNREIIESATVFIPKGAGKSLVVTTLRAELGFSLSARMVRSLVPKLASQTASQFAKTTKLIQHPKKGEAWRERIETDALGIYKTLREAAVRSEKIPGRMDLTYRSTEEDFQSFFHTDSPSA